MKLLTVVSLFFVAFVRVVNADTDYTKNGNTLREGLLIIKKAEADGAEKLSSEEFSSSMALLGYLQGFLEAARAWDVLGANTPFRLPREAIRPRQFGLMLEKYLNDHPEQLHEIAARLCIRALQNGFPNPSYMPPPKSFLAPDTR